MIAPLFLDASGWFAALMPREQQHAHAARVYREAGATGEALWTTTLVVAEVHALVVRSSDARGGRAFLDAVLDSGPSLTVTNVDVELAEAAITRWIRGFANQPFSLCDAISFEVMRRERIARALTFNRDFAVAGFEILA